MSAPAPINDKGLRGYHPLRQLRRIDRHSEVGS